jgi:CBS domain-containing protein
MPTLEQSDAGTISVREMMHGPIVACEPQTTLLEVATLMSGHRIHGVVVEGISVRDGSEHLSWGVVSDLDLLRAALDVDSSTPAGSIATSEALTVDVDDALAVVARSLSDHRCTHLVVVDAGRPVGIVSSLDVIAAYAGL